MAKLRRSELDVFGIAFLDVISCAFGAAILLLIFAKDAPYSDDADIPSYESQLLLKIELEKSIVKLDGQISSAQNLLTEADGAFSAVTVKNNSYVDQFSSYQNELLKLKNKNQSLKTILQNKKSSASNLSASTEYQSGIPSGSKSIVFIIDTSGSMRRYWSTVVSTVVEILSVHKKVKRIQIMSDQGQVLFSHMPTWIRDSKSSRALIVASLPSWQAISSSNPANGLRVALNKYAKDKESLSIYVLGDDFSGNSYDEVLNVVDAYNTSKKTGQKMADIHGIGFPWGLEDRFPTLMREVANQNNGVFVGL